MLHLNSKLGPVKPDLAKAVLKSNHSPAKATTLDHEEVLVSADLVLSNARIYTVDDRNPFAEAMAIRDGRVLAVGRGADVDPLVGPGSRRVDLGGRTVIPGLIDAHLHLLSFGLTLAEVDLQGVASVEGAIGLVNTAVRRARPGEWLQGTGWDRNLFGRLPTRHELDRVAPDNPVLLASKDLHALWVNSRALEIAGIGPESEDPPDGEIVRDPATGLPTGVLKEGARAPLFRAVPAPSDERCEAAVAGALRIAASKGLTGLQSFEEAATFRALQRLRSRGQLALRVCCHLWKDGLEHAIDLGLLTGFGDEWLRLGHLKLFLDGALGSQTAYMLEPYTGTEYLGIQTISREEFRGLVLRAAEAGIATAVHAIGDAANRIALDVYAETAGVWRAAGLRQRIEHVQLLGPGDAERLGALGVIASMQPSHATADWQVAERHWSDRTERAYAWRTVLGAGAPLAFGSDCPVEQIDPISGLYAAVTRLTPSGLPEGGWHPEQRLTLPEALKAYTLGAAYASGEESIKGSLESGKLADFVVLSRDPFAGPPEALLETQIEATVVGGRVVHGALPA